MNKKIQTSILSVLSTIAIIGLSAGQAEAHHGCHNPSCATGSSGDGGANGAGRVTGSDVNEAYANAGLSRESDFDGMYGVGSGARVGQWWVGLVQERRTAIWNACYAAASAQTNNTVTRSLRANRCTNEVGVIELTVIATPPAPVQQPIVSVPVVQPAIRSPKVQVLFTVASPDGDGYMNLRKAMNGSIIRQVPNGTAVRILENATVNRQQWVKVQVASGEVGFMLRKGVR